MAIRTVQPEVILTDGRNATRDESRSFVLAVAIQYGASASLTRGIFSGGSYAKASQRW